MSFDKKVDSFMPKLGAAVMSSFDTEKLKRIELPDHLQRNLIYPQLEKLNELAKTIFKDPETAVDSAEFFDFVKAGFSQIITSIIEESDKLPPNLIAECGVSEASFSNALDRKPIVATDSLATCVGVAGYDKDNKYGFVIHFAHPGEIDESGRMLCDKIRALNPKEPIQIHLRGGIKGQSESLVLKIEQWIELCNKSSCPMEIVSKEVCTKDLLNEQGFANGMSLSLDTRDGTISEYDADANPFSKSQDRRAANRKRNPDDLFYDILMTTALEKPEIKIVYN